MAVKPVIARFLYPQSLRQLTRGRGWNSELTGFLLPFARQDYFYKEYDFCEDTISSDWTASNSNGTNKANFAHVAGGECGTIAGATGETDNGGIGFIFDNVMFDAARNPGIHVRMKVDVVTDVAIEIGICDPPTAAYTICVTDVDTPTVANGVTDGAFVMMDTDQTLKTFALVTDGTTDAPAAVGLGGFAPTAATYFDVILQVYANKAYAIINNLPVFSGGLTLGPDTGVKLQPVITVITRNTTTKLPTIDLIRLWAERA